MSMLIALALATAMTEPSSSIQIKHGKDTVSTIDRSLMSDGNRSPNAGKISDAATLIRAGKWAEAINILDAVIADEESRHQDPSRQFFSARSLTEAVVYSGLAATQNRNSTILDESWAYAYFLRGFVLIDLGKADEAKPYFDKALALAPMNAQMLAERGEWHKSRRDWDNALTDFEAAQSAAELSPDRTKITEQGRALRGIAFVKVEQSDFKGAEKWIKQAIKLNPADAKARAELEFIRSRL